MPESSEHERVPVTWYELIEDSHSSATYALENFVRALPEDLARAKPRQSIAIEFSSAATAMCHGAIVLGPSRCLALFNPLQPHLERAVAEFRSGVSIGNSVRAVGVLSFVNVARCCGAPVPKGAADNESSWLPELAALSRSFTEGELQTLAFASLAARLPELVPKIIGGVHKPFKPGQVFQFNVQGFVRYLAAAMQKGATWEEVEPAWRDFVKSFPRKLASQTLEWVDLMWAARAVMVHFEQRPVDSVAQAMHRFVSLAGPTQ